MSSSFKKLIPLLLFGGVLAGLTASELRAQVRVMPSLGNQPSASTRIGGAQAAASQITQGGNRPVGGIGGVGYRGPVGGYHPGAYGGVPGYGGVYSAQTPANGYLTGAADVISSQAQFMQAQQQANLTKEQVKQAQIDTHRKTFDEWKYEQANMPTAEELRQKTAQAEIDRARGNPPLTEIRSASALNTLLNDIYQAHRAGVFGPNVLLDPELLKHINLTDGRSNSGVGLMRGGGMLDWPYALQNEFFDSGRKEVDKLMAQAAREAQSGKVSFKVIKGLLGAEDGLRADLKTHIHDLTPTEGVNARRYLNELHDTVQTLQDPNVSKYVGGAWTPKGNSIGELANNMMVQGLKFAPCADGDDSYYRSLYQALMVYDTGLMQLASRSPGGK